MFRIMIAEDEPLILQSIVQKIQDTDPDFKVVGEYENGEFAMLELDLLKPHVLLTDIHMPIMDGLTLIEQAKKQRPDLLCAVLTGYRDFEYARRALQLGVAEFLLKPPTEEMLREFLAKLKRELLKDQSLVESELLQQWAYRETDKLEETAGRFRSERRWAQEHFYHAAYAVLLAWRPPRQEPEWGAHPDKPLLQSMLKDGEKLYELPYPRHMRVAVIGCHRLTESRLQEFLQAWSEVLPDPVCVAAAQVSNLSLELSDTLYRLEKTAVRAFPVRGRARIVVRKDQTEGEPHDLPLSNVLEGELGELLSKCKKTEFLRKMQTVLESGEWSDSTRHRWLQSLTLMMRSWAAKHKELARGSALAHWDAELEELIWQAPDESSLRRLILEALASLFEDSEEEKKADVSWTSDLKLYLEQHYMKNLTLTELAERYGLNPSYLGRTFKREYGHSPIDYLIQIRVDIAKRMIREKPRLLFKDVSEMVGYGDPYYFSKIFKQWTGVTPREYKKQGAIDFAP